MSPEILLAKCSSEKLLEKMFFRKTFSSFNKKLLAENF
jgi:hypothetical protein